MNLGTLAGEGLGSSLDDPSLVISPWEDAALAAALCAVDPVGVGGVVLRSLPGPPRERWLALLREGLPQSAPLRRVPLYVTDERLLGGLDLAATLQAGRPVVARGILAEADAGVVVLAMAERLEARAAARLGLVLDSREVVLERDGIARRLPTRFALVALDEGIAADERPPPALLDRLAFHLDLTGIGAADPLEPFAGSAEIAAARERRAHVAVSASVAEALCGAALALGIDSIRAPLLALRVAAACAALARRSEVAEEDAAMAARLVLAPRATALPSSEPAPEERETDDQDTRETEERSPGPEEDLDDSRPGSEEGSLAELVLSAAKAALPAGLLAQLRLQDGLRSRGGGAGKAGVRRLSKLRGRPMGVKKGRPGSGARLDVVETLRAAAPWQRLRRAEAGLREAPVRRSARLQVRREDFRIARFKERTETTVVFAVDASGSTALQRLAEAKGAVELLLAECYVRRDRVALIAFRGRGAELVLSPTRSLARAKRSLAGLPGGGGTPLASGIEAAERLTDAVVRRGGTPLVIVLTDGRANISRDGSPGRMHAEQDALAAARLVRAASRAALVVDTSPRPQTAAQQLAREMGALYLPLPQADSAALCEAVRGAAGASGTPGPRAARRS